MKDDDADGHLSERSGKGDLKKTGIDAMEHPEKDKKQGDSNKGANFNCRGITRCRKGKSQPRRRLTPKSTVARRQKAVWQGTGGTTGAGGSNSDTGNGGGGDGDDGNSDAN